MYTSLTRYLGWPWEHSWALMSIDPFRRCVHSRNLGPTWKQLARMFNGVDEGQVLIAKVNCDTDSTVCVDNHISGYPRSVWWSCEGLYYAFCYIRVWSFRYSSDIRKISSHCVGNVPKRRLNLMIVPGYFTSETLMRTNIFSVWCSSKLEEARVPCIQDHSS